MKKIIDLLFKINKDITPPPVNPEDKPDDGEIPPPVPSPEKTPSIPEDKRCKQPSIYQTESIVETISDLQKRLEDIQYNVSLLVQNQASAADVAAMRRENEAFRSDNNMKLMRKYGIDALIKNYQVISDKIFRINHPITEKIVSNEEKAAYVWMLCRIENQLKQLGIILRRTESGSEIDESTMVVYGSENEDVDEEEVIIETDDENLKHTVKESVCPAFVWTIPSLIGDYKEWYMEPEKVCIYK